MHDAPERKEGEQRRRKHKRGEHPINTLKIGEEVLSHFQEMSLAFCVLFFFSVQFFVNLFKLNPEDVRSQLILFPIGHIAFFLSR